ncbi:beta-aspartyl-peptidase, partial [Salmonella enterica]|nr:beta-aspartyl-peptidase [Salmonella enterica]
MPDLSFAEFTLMQGAHLYTPEDQGISDVLLANGKIIAVARDISPHI